MSQTTIFYINDVKLQNSPKGWDTRNRAKVRSEKYHGLNRNFTQDLHFYFDGYTILKELYENESVNAIGILRVEWFNNKSGLYELESEMSFDFTTYSELFLDGKCIKIALSDNSFTNTLLSRDTVEIPYDRLTTIDNVAITQFPDRSLTAEGSQFTIPIISQVDGYRNAKIYGVEVADKDINLTFYPDAFSEDTEYVGAIRIDTEYNNPSFQETGMISEQIDETPITNCFFKSTANTTLYYNLTFNYDLKSGMIANSFYANFILYKVTYNEEWEQISRVIIEYDTQTSNTQLIGKLFNWIGSINLAPYEGVAFIANIQVRLTAIGLRSFQLVVYNRSNIICDYSEKYPETLCQCLLPHEIFTRLVESITGQQNAFYSEYFGRIDLGYEVNGEGSAIGITNGLLLRGYPIGYIKEDNTISQLTFTFEKVFDVFDKLKCLGMQIEYVNGSWRVRIEKREFFYSQEVISNVLNIEKNTFSKEINPKAYFNEITAGCLVDTYEEFGGIEEYNSLTKLTSCIKNSKNKVDLTLDYQTNVYAKEYARRSRYEQTKTTDTPYDSQIHLIDLTTDDNILYYQRKNEGFELVENIDFITSPMNLDLTPMRQIHAHGWWINTGLWKFPSQYLMYSKSKYPSDLRTLKTGQDYSVNESENILNSVLENPRHTGLIVKLKASISRELWNEIDSLPNGLLKYYDELTEQFNYCNILEISSEPIKNEPTNILGLEANPPDVATIKVLVTDENDFIVTDENILIEIT